MAKILIHGSGITYSYDYSPAIDDLDIEIEEGSFAVLLGQNGSGKSTLAKLFNALLQPQKGILTVNEIDTKDDSAIWQLRKLCGMVFQNPDNQFVSTLVEEDIAFGLENYNYPIEEIPGKISDVLKLVKMEGYEKRSPHTLSGGQKQKIALAGVLALEGKIIIFDEVTSMLDPQGREEVLNIIEKLHREEKFTIVMITHFAEEAVNADHVFIMKEGSIIASGSPVAILKDMDLMKGAGLLPPMPVCLYHDLKSKGITLNSCPLTNEELAEEICRLS